MAILRLKVALEDISPKVWREFLIEDSATFEELHEAIQGVMGWGNYHLYEFNVGDKEIACDEKGGFNPAEVAFKKIHQSPEAMKLLEENAIKGLNTISQDQLNKILENSEKSSELGTDTKISSLITKKDQKFSYTYDFGDTWIHSLTVKGIEEKDPAKKYPVCLDGARACPPEDCGGPYGYEELMEIRKDKKSPEYKERIVEWLGEDYDPEFFDIDEANSLLQEDELGFMPLGKLLKEDNEKIKEIKSLSEREWEYKEFLGAVEFTIAHAFLQDPDIKDKDVELAIRNLKKNYLQDIEFFKTELETDIIEELSLELQKKSITHHELRLVFDYILWAIDNRSWLSDKQAYVKWLPFFLNIYDEEEMKLYEKEFTKKARRLGVAENQIKGMLNKDEFELSEEQKESTKQESEFFAMDDKEKFDFVAKPFGDSYLFGRYVEGLTEKNDFVGIEKLYKRMMELTFSFPIFEFFLGMNYYEHMKEQELGKRHIENAIKRLEEIPEEFFKEKEKMLKDMKKEAKGIGIEL